MRLFVALPVPDEIRVGVEAAVADLRDRRTALRWTRPEGWHLTVAFLGEVPDARVDEVVEVVTRVAAGHGAVGLSLGGAGRFGRRVLWAGVDDEPAGAVATLGEEVQGALAAAGLPVRQQPVQPHLTLARAGRGSVRDEVLAALRLPEGAWIAEEVGVWRSRLGGGRPARYDVVASAALRT